MNNNKVYWAMRAVFLRGLGLRIGLPSYVGQPIYYEGLRRLSVGRKFRLFPGWRIEIRNSASVIIGENVGIGQNLHLTCGEMISIGSGTRIAGNVCITDIQHHFNKEQGAFHPKNDDTAVTTIGDNCFIGYGAVIDHGTKLGDGSVVGANVYVRGEHEPGSVITK